MNKKTILILGGTFLVWRFLSGTQPGEQLTHSLAQFLMTIAVFLVSITLHEFGHAWAATQLGDPTPRAYGRLTLNPLAHLDPLGTLLILAVQFGYAKPVPVNAHYFRRPGRDQVLVALAGPFMNILLMGAAIVAIRSLFPQAALATVDWWPFWRWLAFVGLLKLAVMNAVLAGFNLIPIAPLDGHYLLDRLLPPKQRLMYREHQPLIGMIALFLLLTGTLDPLFAAVSRQVQILALT